MRWAWLRIATSMLSTRTSGSCSEEAGSEGIMECGSASYRPSLEFQGGSFAAALHDALRIFMISGCQSANEHERRLWNRRFHPFNVYTEKKRREKLNYAERHKLWHGRPGRDHGRDGRATKGCPIIQIVLYRCTITRSGAASRVRLGIGRGQAGGITT